MLQPKTKRRQRLLGFSLTEIMAVAAIVSAIPTSAFVRAQQKAVETECRHNLQQIGTAIQIYFYSEGMYPAARFYPDDPVNDPGSIVKILEDSGAAIPRQMWVCPAAPDPLKQRGLTFVYNDTFAGRRSLPNPSKAWLMIEVNCVSKKVPAPHPGGYNILFADGHVITSSRLPSSITAQQQAALEKLATLADDGRRT